MSYSKRLFLNVYLFIRIAYAQKSLQLMILLQEYAFLIKYIFENTEGIADLPGSHVSICFQFIACSFLLLKFQFIGSKFVSVFPSSLLIEEKQQNRVKFNDPHRSQHQT